ncbi:hypothetical protein ACJX0J_030583, partial [Zea mays]
KVKLEQLTDSILSCPFHTIAYSAITSRNRSELSCAYIIWDNRHHNHMTTTEIVEVPREAINLDELGQVAISTEEATPLSILFIYYWLKVVTTDHLDFD